MPNRLIAHTLLLNIAYNLPMRKIRTEIRDPFWSAFSGMMLVVLSIISFIIALWIITALVRTLIGLA